MRPAIHFSAESPALQSFAQNLQNVTSDVARLVRQGHLEVFILDVVPIILDSVVVSLDETALEALETANQRFRKGQPFHNSSPRTQEGKSNVNGPQELAIDSNPPQNRNTRWEAVVRAAIGYRHVLHSGDQLPLPVPSHPITHVPPPPASIQLCEPVSQGLVRPDTRIVIISSNPKPKTIKSPTLTNTNHSVSDITGQQAEGDDTSNEQFFSAAEDAALSPPQKKKTSRVEAPSDIEDSAASTEDESDLSDSGGETLGLSLPSLPTQSTGVFSSVTSATPRADDPSGGGGIMSPGSVVSALSTTTIRGGGSKGKLFDARSLLRPVPDEVIQPIPSSDEDPEARAFVDASLLSKIGCFSGDWVRIEYAPDDDLGTLGSWGISAFDGHDDDHNDWRSLKIYVLPSYMTKKPRYAIDKRGQKPHRPSFSMMDRSPPKVFLPPIVIANLGGPARVRIAKLPISRERRSSRMPASGSSSQSQSNPPTATEIKLQKFATSITYARDLESIIAWSVEEHFKSRRRVVKAGDLIAVPVDTSVGRAVRQGTAAEDAGQKELITSTPAHDTATKMDVAWYKVANARTDKDCNDSPWGMLAVIKPELTMIQSIGDYRGILPDSVSNPWQYYYGVKAMPTSCGNVSSSSRQSLTRPKDFTSTLRRRVRELISAATSPQAICSSLPPVAVLISSTQRQTGKATVVSNACADLGIHCYPIDAFDIMEAGTAGGDANHAGIFAARSEIGLQSGQEYTALLVKHIDMMSSERLISSIQEVIQRSRIFIATTTNVDKIPENMYSLFTYELEMSAPSEKEREGILHDIMQHTSVPISNEVELSSIAMKTAALVAGDLVDVVARASIARQERLERIAAQTNKHCKEISDPATKTTTASLVATVRDILISSGPHIHTLTSSDFTSAIDTTRKNYADSLAAPKIPNVSWSDVGGLTHVKSSILETIQLPLERPELFAKGMKKRSGMLFYGPPGTGKTLLAKAIATEFSLNFFSIKGPELLNMYIGESEANVRRVFQRARDARPCVVFFDELDSVAPKRGNQGDSGGVMDRIVSQLLAELDGMSGGSRGGGGEGVFVIGATNRPDLLDQALLRPGRFDKMLYLGVADTHEKQLTILEALTRKYVGITQRSPPRSSSTPAAFEPSSLGTVKTNNTRFTLHPDLTLRSIAQSLPLTYTGADLYALCSDAMLKSVTRRANAVKAKVDAINAERRDTHRRDEASSEHKTKELTIPQFFDHHATESDIEVVVEERDFTEAQKDLVPSVSAKELKHYERVRATFEGSGDSELASSVAGLSLSSHDGMSNGDEEMNGYPTHRSSSGTLNREKEKRSIIKGKGKAKAPMWDGDGEHTGIPGAFDGGFGDGGEQGDEEMYS